MEKNKIIDTKDLLSEEDEKLLSQIEYIKQNIVNFIKPEVMIEEIKDIINQSKILSFKSKRNSKYISLTKPLFILTIDKEAASKIYDYKFIYQDEESIEGRSELIKDYNFINECIHKEITSKYSEFLSKQLIDRDIFRKILSDNNISVEISEETIRLISFVTASIFGVTIELRQNIVYVEYVI